MVRNSSSAPSSSSRRVYVRYHSRCGGFSDQPFDQWVLLPFDKLSQAALALIAAHPSMTDLSNFDGEEEQDAHDEIFDALQHDNDVERSNDFGALPNAVAGKDVALHLDFEMLPDHDCQCAHP